MTIPTDQLAIATLNTTRRLLFSILHESQHIYIHSLEATGPFQKVIINTRSDSSNHLYSEGDVAFYLRTHSSSNLGLRVWNPEDLFGPFTFVSRCDHYGIVETTNIATPAPETLAIHYFRYWSSPVDKSTTQKILSELSNSIWNEYENALQHLIRPQPMVARAQHEWLIEGHPYHPMAFARDTAAIESILHITVPKPTYQTLRFPSVYFVYVDKSNLNVNGSEQVYESLMKELLDSSFDLNTLPRGTVVLPVLEAQVPIVTELFKNEIKFLADRSGSRIQLPSQSLSNLRTIHFPSLPNYNWKLPLGLTISSAMRTISPATIHNSLLVSKYASTLVKKLTLPLTIITEITSIGFKHPDEHVAKHLGCILRSCPEGNGYICLAALLDRTSPTSDEYQIRHFIPTDITPQSFLKKFLTTFAKAFLPPLLLSFSFECHAQNTLFNPQTFEFAIRDFGGMKFHSTCSIYASIKGEHLKSTQIHDVWKIFMHSGVWCCLWRVAFALGLQEWMVDKHIARDCFSAVLDDLVLDKSLISLVGAEELVNRVCELRKYLLERKMMSVKSLWGMKMGGVYRDVCYSFSYYY